VCPRGPESIGFVPKKTQNDLPPVTSVGGVEVPAWLQDPAFAEDEVRLYLWAASRCGLEVSHWARNTLNAAARAILEIDEDH
jgi:hypothetical protein